MSLGVLAYEYSWLLAEIWYVETVPNHFKRDSMWWQREGKVMSEATIARKGVFALNPAFSLWCSILLSLATFFSVIWQRVCVVFPHWTPYQLNDLSMVVSW